MPFAPGVSGNPGGRPRGAVTRKGLPVHVRRKLVKELIHRAIEEGDHAAQDALALLVIREGDEQRLC